MKTSLEIFYGCSIAFCFISSTVWKCDHCVPFLSWGIGKNLTELGLASMDAMFGQKSVSQHGLRALEHYNDAVSSCLGLWTQVFFCTQHLANWEELQCSTPLLWYVPLEHIHDGQCPHNEKHDQHHLHLAANLPNFLGSQRSWCLPLWRLGFCLWNIAIDPCFITSNIWFLKVFVRFGTF